MRPSPLLAASIAATFLLSALPADAGAQDRARERARQREVERQRDRSLDLESRDRRARDRTEELRERAREMARAYGGQGGRTIITQPGAYAYTFGMDDDRAVIGIAMSAEGRSDTLGVRVSEVTTGGPAERAGLRAGDRITAINGVDLRVSDDDARDPATSDIGIRRLEREVRELKAGDEAELRVLSNGQTRTVRVRTVAASALREFGPGERALSESRIREMLPSRVDAERRAALGVAVGATGSRRDTLGLMIMRVTRDGPAERAGLVEGDRIASINGVDVRAMGAGSGDAAEEGRAGRFTTELARLAPGDEATLRVYSNGQYRTVRVRTGRASEVNRDAQGMGFFFDGGDGFVMPTPPRAFSAPRSPRAPRAPLLEPGRVRVAPTAPRAPMASMAPSASPRVRIVRPGDAARPLTSPDVRSHRIERGAPGTIIRELDADTMRRLRTLAPGSPSVVRVQRRVVRT